MRDVLLHRSYLVKLLSRLEPLLLNIECRCLLLRVSLSLSPHAAIARACIAFAVTLDFRRAVETETKSRVISYTAEICQ